MTTIAPEALDATALDDLDFRAPVLCDVNECSRDKITARVATALLVRTMPCCTEVAPICVEHADEAREAVEQHKAVLCAKHRLITCSHTVLTIEPLS